jgi:hypothetical protein
VAIRTHRSAEQRKATCANHVLPYYQAVFGITSSSIFPNLLFGIALRFELTRFQMKGPEKQTEANQIVPEPVPVHPEPASFVSPGAVNLGEFFTIREPGSYTLKVWPKIYMRSAQGTNLCERLDLPVVSAVFRCEPPKQRPALPAGISLGSIIELLPGRFSWTLYSPVPHRLVESPCR